MHVEVAPAVVELLAHIRHDRRGSLAFTIGNGCCDSTAPYLFEDAVPAPGDTIVGDVDGIPIRAPETLRALYPDDTLVIDVVDDPAADSLSVETEYGRRFVLRFP